MKKTIIIVIAGLIILGIYILVIYRPQLSRQTTSKPQPIVQSKNQASINKKHLEETDLDELFAEFPDNSFTKFELDINKLRKDPLNNAEMIASSIDWSYGRSDLYILIAKKCIAINQNERAINLLQKATQEAEETTDEHYDKVDILVRIARLYHQMGMKEKTKEILFLAETKSDDKEQIYFDYGKLSVVYAEIGETKKSFELLNNAYQAILQQDFSEYELMDGRDEALIYIAACAIETGLEEMAFQIVEKLDNENSRIRALRQIAEKYLDMKKEQKALEIVTKTDDSELTNYIIYRMGAHQAELGRVKEALRLVEDLGKYNISYKIQILCRIANWYLKTGQRKKALETLESIYQFLIDGTLDIQVEDSCILGSIYFKVGEKDKAQILFNSTFKESKQLIEELPNDDVGGIYKVITDIIRVYVECNQDKLAIKTIKEVNVVHPVSDLFKEMAIMYAKIGKYDQINRILIKIKDETTLAYTVTEILLEDY